MSNLPQKAKAIFLEACEKEDDSDRAAYLAEACKSNPPLREHVERLLEAHEGADSLFDRTDCLDAEPDQHESRTIGSYKILQKIGEGGMGIVYMAEQKEPVKRRVALKVIKPGMDSRQVLARFEAERQALAMMDHPNIARVFEAGATEEGRPYFVMELVKGTPITEFSDQNRLPTRDRLQLFKDVCHAVQHAHQKGIIHRDLKPSNVLVAKFDDKPVIKIIDFGVAKATNQDLTERTMFTQFGQVVGTLEYMSPEQAHFNQLDIDTRSDIYSLGVLLYELLVGVPPLEQQRLRTAALDEIMRIIREEEPLWPSTRLSSLGETATSVSESRRTTVHILGKLIRGDIDLIVMKALQKERSHRYATASGLAADISRYLEGQAIEARPPSAWYRLSRAVARNRNAVAAIVSVLLVASIGAAISTVSMFQTIEAQNKAIIAERQAIEAREQEVASQNRVMQDQILLSIMGGDYRWAEEQLDRVRQLGVAEDWIAMMHGLSAFLQGDPNLAATRLAPFVESIDKSPAGFALQANVYGQQGKEDGLFERLAELRDLDRSQFKFEDFLLVGWAMSRWLPSESEQLLVRACELDQGSSLVPRALLAVSRCWLASSLPDRDVAIQKVRESVADLNALHHLLDEDVWVASECATSRVTLAHLLSLSGDKRGAEEEYQSLRLLLSELQNHENKETVWIRTLDMMLRGQGEAALAEFEARHQSGDSMIEDDYLAMFLPSLCLSTEQLARGQRVFKFADPYMQREAGAIWYFLELSKPDSAIGRSKLANRLWREIEDRVAASKSNVLRFLDWAVLKMLGEHSRAEEVAKVLLTASRSRNIWSEEIACAEYMSGKQSDADLLLKRCHGSQVFTAYAHFVIAIDLLSQGDRENSRRHFGAATETGDFQNSIFWWSQAFSSRVDDEDWLPWLTSEPEVNVSTE